MKISNEHENLFWPVPASFSKTVPSTGNPGSFWENRGDRFHCGVDIYAPFGSDVVACDDGAVLKTELFTSPLWVDYWNDTFAVFIQHDCGLVARYAEMEKPAAKPGDSIRVGHVIGRVGRVLATDRITNFSPTYIQNLKTSGNPSMLHLEFFDRFPAEIPRYLGGNTFQNQRPDFLLDPGIFLHTFTK